MAVSGQGYILTGLLGRGRGRGSQTVVKQSPNAAGFVIYSDLLFTATVSGVYTLTAQGGSYSLTGGSANITRTYSSGTILQHSYNVDDSAVNGTTISTTLTGVTSGSALVAFIGVSSAATSISVSDGTSYTAASDGRIVDTNNYQCSQVFYLPNASSGSHTITATVSPTAPYRRIRVFEIAGIASSAIEDRAAGQWQTNVGTTTDSISSGATASTSNANDFILGLTQDTGSTDPGTGTMSPGTGFTLVGTNQILSAEYKNVSSTGTQTATFTDSKNSNRTTHVLALKTTVTGLTNYQLTASGGSYTLIGNNAVLTRSKLLIASGGSYSLAGANANLVKGRVLTAQGGAYSLTGSSANLLRSKNLVASGGSYALSGSAATISKSKLLVASGGSYNLIGASAVITYTAGSAAYTLICQGGSYNLTGASAILSRNRNLTAQGGSYSLAGANAVLLKSKVLNASGGSYSISGSSASILRSKVIQAQGGNYTVTGSSAIISWATAGGAVYPPQNYVMSGITYGPTGVEYTGTMNVLGVKYDITTGQLVKPINNKVVMTL